jgi:hypothetical protein
VLRFPPRLVSFNLQTMEIIDTVTAPNDNGDSGVCAAINCTGDRIYLRTEAFNPTPHGMVYKYTLDPVTGLLGDAEDLVFPVSFIGVIGDGANPLAVTLDGGSLWVSGTNDGMGSASAQGIYIYDTTTGQLTATVTDPTFTNVEDIATLACCASEPAPAASITSVITAGPDRDGNQVIDTTIPLKSNSPSEFTFTVTFDGAGAVGATITDTIPNEWELVSAVSDDGGDVIVSAGARAAQITNFDPLSLLPSDLWSLLTTGSLSRQPPTRSTNYTWQPTNGAGTLTVTVRTRAARRGRFQPSKQGTYPLNAGAAVFGSDGTQLVDGRGDPLVGPRLTVEARKQRR